MMSRNKPISLIRVAWTTNNFLKVEQIFLNQEQSYGFAMLDLMYEAFFNKEILDLIFFW